MTRIIPGRPAAILLTLALVSHALGEGAYDLAYSTYFGGSSWEHARDVFADTAGNVYVCGGTASQDFPTTPGAYDQTFNSGDTSGDECDAFICKFGPDGQLIWSTYLGGPGYDRAYGIEVDAQGYVYVAGRAGQGLPDDAGRFPADVPGLQRRRLRRIPEWLRGQAVPGWLDSSSGPATSASHSFAGTSPSTRAATSIFRWAIPTKALCLPTAGSPTPFRRRPRAAWIAA